MKTQLTEWAPGCIGTAGVPLVRQMDVSCVSELCVTEFSRMSIPI